MKRHLVLLLIASSCSFGVGFADQVAQKTDGSFVGQDIKPIDSSFIGDQSKHLVHEDQMNADVDQQTDGVFVGSNTIKPHNNMFAGDSYDQQTGNSTDDAFAEEASKTPTDGVFIGQDTEKKTDNAFAGNGYGK